MAKPAVTETAASEQAAASAAPANAPSASPQSLFSKAETPERPDITTDEAAVSTETTAETKQDAAQTSTAEVAKWKFRGREYTDDEIIREYGTPDKLKDLLVSAEQLPNLQRKHVELLEGLKRKNDEQEQSQRERAEQARQAQAAQQQRGPRNREEWQKNLSARVKLLLDQEFIDQDDIEVSPKLVHLAADAIERLVQLEEFQQNALKVYQEQFQPVMQTTVEAQGEAERNAFLLHMHATLSAIPGTYGDHFAPLAEPENRAKFIEHLINNINPTSDKVYGERAAEWLASQFIGYQRDAILQALRQANSAASAAAPPAATVKQMAKGEGSGTRPVPDSGKNKDIRAVLARI